MNKLIDTLVRESNGKFLTLTFKKVGGSMRTINGRIGVDGSDYRFDAQNGKPYLLIWEVKSRGYRRVSLDTVERIASQGAVLYTAS